MKALVLGADGQDGYYVMKECRRLGIEHIGASSRMLDVSIFENVSEAVREIKPDYIFQLAARSTTSHEALFHNHEAIATGTINVLEAVKRHLPQAKVLVVGSAVQFKNYGNPINELCVFEASSAYAAARIYAVEAARYYASIGVKAYVAYLFHHDSVRRHPPHLAARVAQAARERVPVEIEFPEVEKEWTWAGDTARALLTLLQQDEVREVVVGSGEAHRVATWVEACYEAVGLNWRDYLIRKTTDREPEWQRLVSNPSTIKSLGWDLSVKLRDLAASMVHQTEANLFTASSAL